MKLILLTLAIAAVSHARPAEQAPPAPIGIVKYDNEGVNADGSYQWSLETENGITAEEQGHLKEAGKDGGEPAEEVSGSFQYKADDGTPIQLSYIANENGFQPQGEHLPTPPPIPPAIQRLLEWIAAHPEPEEQPEKTKN